MENKSITQYAILFSAVFLIALMFINLFKTSNSLKESKQKIDNALNEIKESNALLKEQSTVISDLKKLNDELNKKVFSVDSINRVIKKNIDANIYSANKNILYIKGKIDSIKVPSRPVSPIIYVKTDSIKVPTKPTGPKP